MPVHDPVDNSSNISHVDLSIPSTSKVSNDKIIGNLCSKLTNVLSENRPECSYDTSSSIEIIANQSKSSSSIYIISSPSSGINMSWSGSSQTPAEISSYEMTTMPSTIGSSSTIADLCTELCQDSCNDYSEPSTEICKEPSTFEDSRFKLPIEESSVDVNLSPEIIEPSSKDFDNSVGLEGDKVSSSTSLYLNIAKGIQDNIPVDESFNEMSVGPAIELATFCSNVQEVSCGIHLVEETSFITELFTQIAVEPSNNHADNSTSLRDVEKSFIKPIDDSNSPKAICDNIVVDNSCNDIFYELIPDIYDSDFHKQSDNVSCEDPCNNSPEYAKVLEPGHNEIPVLQLGEECLFETCEEVKLVLDHSSEPLDESTNVPM